MLPESRSSKAKCPGGGSGGGGNSSSPAGKKSLSPFSAAGGESFLRQALFNGGCNDVIVFGNDMKNCNRTNGKRKGGRGSVDATTTVAWPQCSFDLRGIVVHLPVDRTNPFGRSLRVSVGGFKARDLSSASASSSTSANINTDNVGNTNNNSNNDNNTAAAAATTSSGSLGGGREGVGAPSGQPAARRIFPSPSSSRRRAGIEASIASIGAAWTPGRKATGGSMPSSAVAEDVELRSNSRGEGTRQPRAAVAAQRRFTAERAGGTSGVGAGGGGGSRGHNNQGRVVTDRLCRVEGGEQQSSLVVLDLRSVIAAKVRLVDEGGVRFGIGVGTGSGIVAGGRGGVWGLGKTDRRGEEGLRGATATESVVREEGGEEKGKGEGDGDLGVQKLPPPMAMIKEVKRYYFILPKINVTTNNSTQGRMRKHRSA